MKNLFPKISKVENNNSLEFKLTHNIEVHHYVRRNSWEKKKTSKYVGQYVVVLEFFGISLVFLSATSWSATVLSFLSTITWGLPFEDGGKITYLPQDICIIKWKTLVGAEGYIGGRGGIIWALTIHAFCKENLPIVFIIHVTSCQTIIQP